MHSEKEIYGLLIDIARADDRILAVYMNGSRMSQNVYRSAISGVYQRILVVQQ